MNTLTTNPGTTNHVMTRDGSIRSGSPHRRSGRLLLAAAAIVGLSSFVSSLHAPVVHADDPWTVPIPPPRCTKQQADSG
ncbi:MAG TPA: hypothetical protein VMM60_18640, partial [Ilumatobacter sp.]|nr:hypothetical protein [Ilumatobacter sp.]